MTDPFWIFLVLNFVGEYYYLEFPVRERDAPWLAVGMATKSQNADLCCPKPASDSYDDGVPFAPTTQKTKETDNGDTTTTIRLMCDPRDAAGQSFRFWHCKGGGDAIDRNNKDNQQKTKKHFSL